MRRQPTLSVTSEQVLIMSTPVSLVKVDNGKFDANTVTDVDRSLRSQSLDDATK